MRPSFDDYDELDETSFDNFATTRRLLSEKQHQKAGGRKRRGRAHHDRWADDNGDSHDYIDDEFDKYYELRFDD